MKLNYTDNSKKKENKDDSNPFTKQILTTSINKNKGNRYSNESISNKFKRNKKKKVIDNRQASEHKLFEMFSDESFIPNDLSLNMVDNDYSQNIPKFYDDIDFGD